MPQERHSILKRIENENPSIENLKQTGKATSPGWSTEAGRFDSHVRKFKALIYIGVENCSRSSGEKQGVLTGCAIVKRELVKFYPQT